MMKKIQVAIDGPVSSGKSSVGSQVAAALDFLFIDTGLMYRAIAWKIQQTFASRENWGKIASESKIEWKGESSSPSLFLDGQDVTHALYYPEISLLSSSVATDSAVRKALVKMQQESARGGGVVMVGRDIGTVVLPNARVKIFLTAFPESRAARRHKELLSRGVQVTLETVHNELIERDKQDSSRKDSPLRPAPDSVTVDTTNLTLPQVVDRIVSIAKAKGEL